MSKHITLENLGAALPPLKHLIDKKAEGVDWNENDPSASGYIRNRPFYSIEEKTNIVSYTNIAIGIDSYVELSANFPLEVGKTYIVTLNGITYECIARYWSDADAVLIGNGTICGYGDGDSGNGEPFSCDYYTDGELYLNANAGDYSISIFHIASDIHKIDSKYLPEDVVTKNDLVAITADQINEICGNTVYLANEVMV